VNGNIGATGLQAMAANIEKLVKKNHDRNQLMKEFEAFANAQTTMVNAIAGALSLGSDVPKVAKPTAVKKQMDQKVLSQFISLLKDDDTQATLYLEQHEDDFKAHFSEDIVHHITEALLAFDFEKALALTTI
jgi:flagellar motor component MotA